MSPTVGDPGREAVLPLPYPGGKALIADVIAAAVSTSVERTFAAVSIFAISLILDTIHQPVILCNE